MFVQRCLLLYDLLIWKICGAHNKQLKVINDRILVCFMLFAWGSLLMCSKVKRVVCKGNNWQVTFVHGENETSFIGDGIVTANSTFTSCFCPALHLCFLAFIQILKVTEYNFMWDVL